MSTHCYISQLQADGLWRTIYCHSDGYPSYVGKMLEKFFSTAEKVEELINLGDISGIRRDGTVEAYYRDYGDTWENVRPCVGPGPESSVDIRHQYYFKDGQWSYKYLNADEKPLAQAIAEDDKS
jgi:hypothetical protein